MEHESPDTVARHEAADAEAEGADTVAAAYNLRVAAARQRTLRRRSERACFYGGVVAAVMGLIVYAVWFLVA